MDDQEIVNAILGIAPDDFIPCERTAPPVLDETTVETTVESIDVIGEELNKKKKKKKNNADFFLGVIERFVDILVTAAPKLIDAIGPKLLEVITSYLNAGGDPNVEVRGVPLVKVCENHPEIVDLLMKCGAMGR